MNAMLLEQIVHKLKVEHHFGEDIVIQKRSIGNRLVYVVYNEPLTSSDKISDFVIRSLNMIKEIYSPSEHLDSFIINHIDNFKIKKIFTYDDICYHLHYGFTILLIEGSNCFLTLETKANLSRSISSSQTETSLRGSMDSFVENIQTNVGLIRRRIKDKNLWIQSLEVGRYTKTRVSIFYLHGVAYESIVRYVHQFIQRINVDGILSSGDIKNMIEKENKSVFPTIFSTERPDKVCQALLDGRIVVMVDCSQFALILPVVMNDLFLSVDDSFGKSINISVTRVIRYLAFFITLFTPALYIAFTSYHQDMLPTEFLISFASQRANVPFPAFVEAFVMLIAFEILRECDLRSPTFTTSALSTVGALILGDAAVSAGIVSPIMIIVVALTSLSALVFVEPEVMNGFRWYRLLLMIGAILLGMVGVLFGFMILLIQLCSLTSFGVPYGMPFAPFSRVGIQNSVIKFPIRFLNKRDSYFSYNKIKRRSE